MAGSIFKEVAITPQTFDKFVLLDDLRKFEKFLNAMDDLSESGMIVGVYTDWINKVDEFIDRYDDNDKHDIKNVLNFLKDRQRIVCVPKNLSNSNDEDIWINQAEQISRIREFDLIIASKDTDHAKQITSIDRKALKNKGAIVEPQSNEFMKSILSPILGYAEIVKVIDPYFDLSKERYAKAFQIICQTLGNQHEHHESGIIDIHTSINSILKDKKFDWNNTKEWPLIIKEQEKKYGHKITIYMWEETVQNKWHDRWIITNQCGVALGKGSDISERTDSTWGLVDWEKIPEIAGKFPIDKNREVYRYIGKIDSNKANRERWPEGTNVISIMTEEEKKAEQHIRQLELEAEIRKRELERAAKKANVKDFRKNK